LALTSLATAVFSWAPAEKDMTSFARSSNAFGLDLWRRLPASGNQVFSPASIATALAMTWGGAQGETAAELARVRELLEAVEAGGATRYPPRFAVRERERVVLVHASDLEAVVAAGNYVQLIAGGRKHLLRLTLAEMERQLDPVRFARVHRTTILNVDRIREIQTDPHGSGIVVSESGASYRMSRSYRDRLLPKGKLGAS